MTDQAVSIPIDFSAREHQQRMAEGRAASYHRVAVRFDSGIAHMVREGHDEWQQLTEHEHGCVTLAFDASDLAWPCRWVLAYQDRARVVDPPEPATLVRDSSRAIAARYLDSGG